MADVNVNAPAEQAPAMAPPTRIDDQILPRNRWVAGKKKATIIMIPSVRFSKLIIRHLQSKNKFHPRPGSPLHLPNEESVLGYLKFSAKGTKWEVFGMPIPYDLITDDIRGEQYYNAYLEKVAKHQRYLVGEEVSDLDSPAPKLDKATKHKATKKSKPSAPKVAPVTKPAVAKASKSQQTTSAPAKPQEKKQKLVTEISKAPSPAKRSKSGKVTKKRKPKSPLQLIDEIFNEGIPENEPRLDDEEATMQRAIEECLKEVHDAHRGLLPPVLIREPDSRKFQPLPETPKKKSPTEQYIFQRRTSTPTESSSHDESSSLYAELGLTVSEIESDEEVPGIVARVQDEGQAGPNPEEKRIPTEQYIIQSTLFHTNLNPLVQDEGQVGPNLGDDAASQPPLSHVVHTGPNLEHMDLEASITSIQPNPEQMDEEFTTTAYPNELQLHTISILAEKSTEDPNLRKPILKEAAVQAPLPTLTATVTTTTTTTTLPLPPQPQQGSSDSILIQHIGKLEQHMADLVSKVVDEIVMDAVDWAIQAPLKDRFRDLPKVEMKEILHHHMWESNSYKAHEDHKKLYEALEQSMARDHTDQLLTDLAEVRKKKKGDMIHQKLHLGLHLISHPLFHLQQSTSTAAPSSSKTTALAEYTAWTTTDTRLKPSVSSIPEDLHMDDDTTPDEQVHSSGDEDIGHDHIPTVNLKQNWWKPLTEDMPATPVPTWSIPSSDLPVPMNNWASAPASTYAPPPENSLLAQTGDMAIFMD
ncbi:hypothetical protein Tco_0469497 [Tanacetum coccineum]